jgi:hypothetical protein
VLKNIFISQVGGWGSPTPTPPLFLAWVHTPARTISRFSSIAGNCHKRIDPGAWRAKYKHVNHASDAIVLMISCTYLLSHYSTFYFSLTFISLIWVLAQARSCALSMMVLHQSLLPFVICQVAMSRGAGI